jgi:phosphoenolpyruvate carboxykinase (GTP)
LTPDGDIWWEGIGSECPAGTITWTNEVYDKASGKPAAHPNARFTAPAFQCPCIDPAWEDPNGVPISAILFGGRRPSTVPLVYQAMSWAHGTFMGSVVGSEVTAAAIGLKAGVRRDPFAMLPFCGYNMADYFGHWLTIGKNAPKPEALPKIFNVNWFRKDKEGKWLWPGYGDNMRVLAWIFGRCEGTAAATETPIGFVPTVDSIDISGMDVTKEDIAELVKVDKSLWKEELELIKEQQASLGERYPKELKLQVEQLEARLV